jgi:hypothetical protein
MDTDVKEAVLELAGFYGMSLGDEYIKAIVGGKNTTDAVKAAVDSSIANPAAPFNEDKKKFLLLKDAVESIKDIADVEKMLCVTADNGTDGDSIPEKIRNVFGTIGQANGDQGKGAPANGGYYTLDEMRDTDNQSNQDETPVHVIQVFTADHTPTSANTETVALWLNSIPGLEMSRAVPFLDVRISLPGAAGDNPFPPDGKKPMSLFNFLNGNKAASTEAKKMMSSNFLEDIADGQQQLDSPNEHPNNPKVVSSMDIFTSPQTLLAGKTSELSDPFRPFMSFDSFSITHQPAGGMMSFQTAEMSMMLHDRTRLNEVLGLVAPSAIGKTQIEVHYGWSHPDHNKLGRPSDSQVNNRFGKLINAMRSVEIYNVTSSDYSFNDSGEVEITVNLSLAGSNIAATAEVTSSVAENKEEALNKLFEGIRQLMTNLRSGPRVGKISFPSYVTASASIGGASQIKRADLRKLTAFISRARGSSNTDLKSIGQELDKAYGSGPDSFKEFKKSKKEVFDAIMARIKTNVDPFLPTRTIGNVTTGKMRTSGRYRDRKAQKYVSFGKAFSVFVAEAFKAKGTQFSEIQILFYPINESASFAHTLNIAQFPIELSDFKTVMTAKMDPIQKMTIGRFLSIVNSYYLRDQGSAVYGMNSLFGSRETKDGEVQSSRKRARAFKESDQFAEGKLDVLRRAYGFTAESDADFTFRMPQITVKYETAPANSKEDQKAAPILRIHVMDQACGKAEQLKDVLMGFGGDGTFVVKKREPGDTNNARVPGHGKIVTENLEKLKDLVEDLGGGIYKIKTNSDATSLAFDLKDKIKTMFPTVTYGAANSNMTRADLSTVSDSSMNTIMMMRQDSTDGDNDVGTEGGLPLQIMPTQLSVETMGCPYVSFGQQFFIDFNTNTTADNFYAVTGVKHEFSSGQFTTNIDMVQLDGFGTFRSALGNLRKLKVELETLPTPS